MTLYKRKLFTRTPYEHYGTGIASGLADERPGFAVGGRVNFQEGGGPSIDELKQQAQSRDLLKTFQNDATNQLSLSLSDIIYQDFIENFSELKNFDAKTLSDYYAPKIQEFFNSLPEDLRQNLTPDTRKAIIGRFDEVIAEVSAKEKSLFGLGPESNRNAFMQSGKVPIILRSIENREGQLDTFIDNYTGKLGGLESTPTDTTEPEIDADETDMDTGTDTDTGTETEEPAEDLGGIKSAIVSGEGRQEAVDYFKRLQEETELKEKARRQAVQAGFINFGAADPVQEGESTMQAIFKAFQDPMATLRERDYKRAEDIYTSVRDAATDDLEKPDSVKLIEFAQQSPENAALVQQILGPSASGAGFSGADLANVVGTLEPGDEELMARYNISKEELKKNRGYYLNLYAEQVMAGGLTAPGQTIAGPAQDLTTETLTQPTLKDGGRIGLQEGGDAAAEAMAAEAQMPTDNAQGMQETPQMTFQALRQALPDYVSDDVVTLLAKDPQALAEFVEIQTVTQVQDFEDKYRVELNLPQEDVNNVFPEAEII
mgnify:CR=1 FL=1